MTVGAAGWAPCSDASRGRGDPLDGTAPRGDTWFLVESSAGWGRHAFLDPPFDVQLGRALVRRLERSGVRPLAIRRVGRRETPSSTRWAFVDSRPGRESVRWGQVGRPADLLDIPVDGSAGDSSDEPIFAVCTHGRHDRCCAVRGRAVAARLADRYPEQTWECSHLGGDRFAGTMVVLPLGLYYGRVDDGDALDVADATFDGTVVPHLLRGRSSLSRPVQVAQAASRSAFGDLSVGAYAPLREVRSHDRWHVELSGGASTIAVTLVERLSAPLLSTCAATLPVAVPTFVAVDVEQR